MPIESLMTFNRLKQLSSDPKVVVEAIKTSDQLVVISMLVFMTLVV